MTIPWDGMISSHKRICHSTRTVLLHLNSWPVALSNFKTFSLFSFIKFRTIFFKTIASIGNNWGINFSASFLFDYAGPHPTLYTSSSNIGQIDYPAIKVTHHIQAWTCHSKQILIQNFKKVTHKGSTLDELKTFWK